MSATTTDWTDERRAAQSLRMKKVHKRMKAAKKAAANNLPASFEAPVLEVLERNSHGKDKLDTLAAIIVAVWKQLG
jgi:hypothetical protein